MLIAWIILAYWYSNKEFQEVRVHVPAGEGAEEFDIEICTTTTTTTTANFVCLA